MTIQSPNIGSLDIAEGPVQDIGLKMHPWE